MDPSTASSFAQCEVSPDAGQVGVRPRRTLAAVLLVSLLAAVPPPASAGNTEKPASKESGKRGKAEAEPARAPTVANTDRSNFPPLADSNKQLPASEGSAKPESKAKEQLPTAPARNASDPALKAEPRSPSVGEALAKFQQVAETAYGAFGKTPGDMAKAGTPSRVAATADQITSGPGNTVTFRGHVKISLPCAVLDAERVVIDLSGKPSEKAPSKAVVTAMGKYRMAAGKILLIGSKKNSKLEIREDGIPFITEYSTMRQLPERRPE